MHRRIAFFPSLAIFGALILSLFSCNQEASLLGLELLPSRDQEPVSFNDSGSLAANMFSIDSISGYRAVKPFLGSLNDPVFGITEGSVAVQFIYQLSNKDFGTNPVADSLVLYMKIDTAYGDTLTPQTLRIFPLTERFYADSVYFSNLSMEGKYNPAEYVEISVIPSAKSFQVNLPTEWAQRLVEADSMTKSNPDTFLNFFKGIYLRPERIHNPGSGALMTADLFAQETYMRLYYHNDSTDSLKTDYEVNSTYSARLGLLYHDYSGTAINGVNDTLRNDSVLFVQSLGGLGLHLCFPGFDAWKDSLPMTIHKAELFVTIDPAVSASFFRRPSKLEALMKNSSGNFANIADASLTTVSGSTTYDFVGGNYDEAAKSYRFTLTYHLQRYLQGLIEKPDIYIFPSNQGSDVTGQVLRNGKHIRFRLKVTYSKY